MLRLHLQKADGTGVSAFSSKECSAFRPATSKVDLSAVPATRIHRQPGQKTADTRMAALPFQPHNQPHMKYGQVRQQVMIAWHNELPNDQRYA